MILGFFYCLIVCTVCRQKRRSLAKQAATSNLIPMKKVAVRQQQPEIQIHIELPSGVFERKHVSISFNNLIYFIQSYMCKCNDQKTVTIMPSSAFDDLVQQKKQKKVLLK